MMAEWYGRPRRRSWSRSSVKPGDIVSAGDRLAVVEAMKMETQVVAPFSGKIRQVMAIPNVQVSTGDPLLADRTMCRAS